MNAVERIVHYSSDRLVQEAPYEKEETKPASSWPREGALVFKDVVMAYRSDLKPVSLLPHILFGSLQKLTASSLSHLRFSTECESSLSISSSERKRSRRSFNHFPSALWTSRLAKKLESSEELELEVSCV